MPALSLRHVWQRVIRGAGRFKVRNLIGHGFCCILFELALALLLVSYRTATPLTVLMSSNKDETAVQDCYPVLSVSLGLLSRKDNFFT